MQKRLNQVTFRTNQQTSKVSGTKTNIQNSVAFLYNNKILKINKENSLLTIALKTIKHLGINLIKEMKDLYPKNYKTLRKEIEEDTSKWKNSPRSCM